MTESATKRVAVYADGSCHGNPGPGGWAAILECNGQAKELYGAEPATTNNQMELRAVIEGLRALKERCDVDVWSDSRYVIDGMTSWLKNWKKRGWQTADKKPVKNVELWQALDAAASQHAVRWHWVRGHDGHPQNERCDQLANDAIRQMLSQRNQR